MVQTCIAIMLEPWFVKGTISGLGSCGKVLKANTADKTRTCIITKGVDASQLKSTVTLLFVHCQFIYTYTHILISRKCERKKTLNG